MGDGIRIMERQGTANGRKEQREKTFPLTLSAGGRNLRQSWSNTNTFVLLIRPLSHRGLLILPSLLWLHHYQAPITSPQAANCCLEKQ